MATYVFDDEKAQAVCERVLAGAHRLHKAEAQADIDGFWRVLRSEAGQAKLRVAASKVGPIFPGVVCSVCRRPSPCADHPPILAPLTPVEEEDLRDG